MNKLQMTLLRAVFLVIGLFTIIPTYAASCAGGTAVGASITGPIMGPVTVPLTKKPILPTTALTPAITQPVIPVVAKVVWVKGTFNAIGSDKKTRPLKADSPINLNDTLVTTANSQAEIVFSDYTTMTFRESTSFFVKKYEYHPEVKQGSVGNFTMDLIEGGYRTVTGKIAKANPSDYQVNTQVAIMGVRGTDYAAFFHSCQTYMKLYHGKPTVHNAQGTIELSSAKPYALVPSATQAPIILATQPAVFKQTLPIVPAVFTLPIKPGVNGAGGAGGGKICGPGSGSGIIVNFH